MFYGGTLSMKKLIAILLAMLTVFSVMTVAVYAEDTDEPPVASAPVDEEKTTRNILTEDGNVVPVNETQLKFAFFYKIIEKIFSFVLGIFGKEVDDALAGGVDSIAKWIDEAISNLSAGLAEANG